MPDGTNPRAVMGGNQPPLDQRLELDHAELLKRAKEAENLVPAQVRAIETDEEAAAYAQTAADIKKVIADADDTFEVEKKPWREGGQTVDSFFRFRTGIGAAVKRLTTALDNWQTAKLLATRKAEAERNAQEREAERLFGGDAPVEVAPPVKAQEVTRVVASTGVMAAGTVKWGWRVVDEKKIPRRFYTRNDKAIDTAVTALKALGGSIEDAKDSIKGIEIFEHVKASIRQ